MATVTPLLLASRDTTHALAWARFPRGSGNGKHEALYISKCIAYECRQLGA
jgi:hypothetical protein